MVDREWVEEEEEEDVGGPPRRVEIEYVRFKGDVPPQ